MDLEHNENEELEVTPAEPEAAPEAEPETAPVPEAEPEENKPAEKKPGMSKGAKIAIFLAALALVAAIAACVLLITGRKDHPAGRLRQRTARPRPSQTRRWKRARRSRRPTARRPI